MSDEVDRANDYVQATTDAAIAAVTNLKQEVEATGECHECGEPLASGKRWCDSECRDAWQRWNPGK